MLNFDGDTSPDVKYEQALNGWPHKESSSNLSRVYFMQYFFISIFPAQLEDIIVITITSSRK